MIITCFKMTIILLSLMWTQLLVNSLQIIRLARKLPMGDVNALKGNSDTIKDEEEPLDENDLTWT
jgi:hypothetical protein